MDTDAARARFATAPVARLATVDEHGHPHLVPIVFALAGDVVYSAVDHKPKRHGRLQRLANLAAHPHACVLADQYDDGWSALWWVRGDGTGRVVTDRDEAERAIDLLAARYHQYAERRPEGPVLAVDVSRWSGWTAYADPETTPG